MTSQKYSVNQYLIDILLAWVKSGEIAIPEIQRPFVWDAPKVRDLLDSLYQGYPVGYIIAWRNPKVRLKDGSLSEGKKILIDGQQRVTALAAALLGQRVIGEDYRKKHIRIAFHPITEQFEVTTAIIEKDKAWFADVAPIVTGEQRVTKLITEYCAANFGVDEDLLEDRIEKLKNITKRQIGLIELAADLDIETVTEIFIRINSKGVVLSQADFVMSKIAANEELGGHHLRKAIDYFCHIAQSPDFCSHIEQHDNEFASSVFFHEMEWLRQDNEDLYDPSYSDLLRVAFTSQFSRGKLADLVGLLSGRNFETRSYEQAIEENSFARLRAGVLEFINKTHFQRFLMIVKSAGLVDKKLIRSGNALNFAYVLYLRLKRDYGNEPKIETWVRRWLVFSLLTGRYSSSPESQIDYDIRQIAVRPFSEYLAEMEAAHLSDAFWDVGLIQALNTSVATSAMFNVFLAAQAKFSDRGFLSKDITVRDLLTHRGDIHHVFPKNHLKKRGLSRGDYNQIANYAYTQQEINIGIGDQSPAEYFPKLVDQCAAGKSFFGGIVSLNDLTHNLEQNAIPLEIVDQASMTYDAFLDERRHLIAKKIKRYYLGL